MVEYMKKDGKLCKGCAKTTAGCGSHKKMIATSAKADSIIDKLERTMELLQNVEADAEIIEETNNVCDDIVEVAEQITMSPNKIVNEALAPSDILDNSLDTFPRLDQVEKLRNHVAVYTAEDKPEKPVINSTGLFGQLFDMETGGPRVSGLKTISEPFHEKFDHNKLAFILNNLDEIKALYRPNARDSLSLDKYYEKSKTGNEGLGSLRVKYLQNGKNTIRGRYQAMESLSGQNMVREVRHTIFDDYYVDMDMDNCHPVITVWLCKNLSIPCEYMAKYVEDRENHMNDVIRANPELSRDDVKRLFLSINYGGKTIYDDLKTKTPFLVSYYNESAAIKHAVCSALTYFKNESDKARKKRGRDGNLEGAAMSHVCCFVENQLLMIIIEYLKSKVSDISDSILCFDGIMIRKAKFSESYLDDLEKIFNDLDIPIKLSVKSMKPIDLKPFGFDSNERYTFGGAVSEPESGLCLDKFYEYGVDEAALSDKLGKAHPKALESIVCNEIFQLLKLLPKELLRTDEMITSYEIFSRDIFTLKEIALLIKKVFAYIYNDGEYFIMAKSIDTIRYKDGDVQTICYLNKGGKKSTAFGEAFTVSIGKSLYSINLKKCLVHCAKGITYRNADVIPHSPLETPPATETFNLFGKYQHQYDPNFVIDEELVGLWTNHIREVLAASNVEVGEYLLNWFAHMLQRPNVKTSTVPLIKGTQGCGKNFTVNVFQRYVMNPSLSTTCPDMDKMFSRFNAASMGKILVVLDEAIDSCNRGLNNKMKNFITEDRRMIEQKGRDPFEVSDFSNYFIITNNDFASIIEKYDRRYICLIASDHRVGDRAYFNKMASSLLNVGAGCHIFHWLLRRDLSNFCKDDIPKTEYKKELSARQTDSVVKWLLSMHEDLVDQDDNDEQSLLTGAWYGVYSGWCRDAGESKTLSLSIFTNILNREGFAVKAITIRDGGGRKTIRPRAISREIIERNLSEYITLCVPS